MKWMSGVNSVRWINEWDRDGATFEALQKMPSSSAGAEQAAPAWRKACMAREAGGDDMVYVHDRNPGRGSEDLAALADKVTPSSGTAAPTPLWTQRNPEDGRRTAHGGLGCLHDA